MEERRRRGRGPGKTPPLVSTSIRLSVEVMGYFNTHYPKKKQAAMRKVLTEYVQQQMLKEPHHGTQETVNE